LQQRQSGDWSLRFTVADIDQRLVGAAMGTRYQCVLVEVNDDETPVNHTAIERDKWRDLGPAKQAGIRCKEPIFWAYLSEEQGGPQVTNEEAAAILVRDICGVASRADLGKPGHHASRTLWYNLDTSYQAWKARENAR
jgi:hypothetical protein